MITSDLLEWLNLRIRQLNWKPKKAKTMTFLKRSKNGLIQWLYHRKLSSKNRF